MRFVVAVLAGVGLALASTAPAGAGVAYSVEIRSPEPDEEGYAIGRGAVTVRAAVSGGVGKAKRAAYHVRPAGDPWTQADSVPLRKVEEGIYESVDSPLETALLANGVYVLEVRVWGDVPPYRPSNAGTFASHVIQLRVDNVPSPPDRLSGGTAVRALRVTWRAAPSSSREDFLGYRVLIRAKGCAPAAADHRVLVETSDTTYATSIDPGRYCLRVVSVRWSPVSETIASTVSDALIIRVADGASGRIGGAPRAPRPPALGTPDLIVSDAPFGEDLPYGSRTVTEEVDVDEDPLSEEELGPDPKTRPLAIAAGLVLMLAAVLIRSFLRRVPSER